jgi:hypothetical protein
MSSQPYATFDFFHFGKITNILASFLIALEMLSGIRHLQNSALLIARIVRYFHVPTSLDIHWSH